MDLDLNLVLCFELVEKKKLYWLDSDNTNQGETHIKSVGYQLIISPDMDRMNVYDRIRTDTHENLLWQVLQWLTLAFSLYNLTIFTNQFRSLNLFYTLNIAITLFNKINEWKLFC